MKKLCIAFSLLFLSIQIFAQGVFEKKSYVNELGQSLSYQILYPANYNPSIQYPVVLVLHGAGGRVDQRGQGGRIDGIARQQHIGLPAVFLHQAQHLHRRPDVEFLCRQCPLGDRAGADPGRGRRVGQRPARADGSPGGPA